MTPSSTKIQTYRFVATLPRPDRHGHKERTGIVRTAGPKTDAEVIDIARHMSHGDLDHATFTKVFLAEDRATA